MLNKFFSKFKKPDPSITEDRLIIDSDAFISKEGKLTESFGIRIFDGSIAPFSRRGDRYPAIGKYSFSTDSDEQDEILLEFHRCASGKTSESSFVGVVAIKGYKLEAAREPLILLHYELANNQIVVWATNEKNNGELTLSFIKKQLKRL